MLFCQNKCLSPLSLITELPFSAMYSYDFDEIPGQMVPTKLITGVISFTLPCFAFFCYPLPSFAFVCYPLPSFAFVCYPLPCFAFFCCCFRRVNYCSKHKALNTLFFNSVCQAHRSAVLLPHNVCWCIYLCLPILIFYAHQFQAYTHQHILLKFLVPFQLGGPTIFLFEPWKRGHEALFRCSTCIRICRDKQCSPLQSPWF